MRDLIHYSSMLRIPMNRVAMELKSGRHKAPTTKEEFEAIVRSSQENITPEQMKEEAKSLMGAWPVSPRQPFGPMPWCKFNRNRRSSERPTRRARDALTPSSSSRLRVRFGRARRSLRPGDQTVPVRVGEKVQVLLRPEEGEKVLTRDEGWKSGAGRSSSGLARVSFNRDIRHHRKSRK